MSENETILGVVIAISTAVVICCWINKYYNSKKSN